MNRSTRPSTSKLICLPSIEKIADELNGVLANLEGSTLVKRLKAVSREQLQVAGKLSDRIDEMFGRATQLDEANRRSWPISRKLKPRMSKRFPTSWMICNPTSNDGE